MNGLELEIMNQAVRLLVLEDDPEDFMLLSGMTSRFVELKAEVIRASTFEEGLQMLSQSVFDAVVVDYRLGARDGLEFIVEARARGFRSPMIFLTGQGAQELDLAALRLGA